MTHSSVATSSTASVCRPATLLPCLSSVIAKQPGPVMWLMLMRANTHTWQLELVDGFKILLAVAFSAKAHDAAAPQAVLHTHFDHLRR